MGRGTARQRVLPRAIRREIGGPPAVTVAPPAAWRGRRRLGRSGTLRGGAALALAALTAVASPSAAEAESFAAASIFVVGQAPYAMAGGDLDGDGTADLVTANRDSNNVSVLLGDGTGGLGPARDHASGQVPLSVAIGDLNGDGKQDLAVANNSDEGLTVLLGDGTGEFGAARSHPGVSSLRWVSIGDLNGDGKADLAAASFDLAKISVLLGDGTGSFEMAGDYEAGHRTTSVAIGDLNGDGKADLATPRYDSNRVSVLLGDGTGSFGTVSTFGTGLGPHAVVIGDLTGDGHMDLATANAVSRNVSVLLGDGEGHFEATQNSTVGRFPHHLAIGDLDGDRKPDLVTANLGSNNVSVLLGDGIETFQPARNYASVGLPAAVVIDDFNGDGKPDLAASNAGSHNVSVLLNTSTPALAAAPSTVDFGDQAGATTSRPQLVKVTNTGDFSLEVANVSIAGANPGDFAVASDGCSGSAMDPDESCTIGVTFAPTALGPRGADLTISGNAAGPHVVPLSGNGVNGTSDLSISIGATPNPVRIGQELTYSITVKNWGPTDAAGAVVTDRLPASVTFSRVTATQGSCRTPAVGQSGALVCSTGRIANGQAAAIQINVTVVVRKASIVNTAEVAPAVTTVDPVPANDTASIVVKVK